MFKRVSIRKVGLTLICFTLTIMTCCNYQLFESRGVSLLESIVMSLTATAILAIYALVTVTIAIITGSIIIACVKYFI